MQELCIKQVQEVKKMERQTQEIKDTLIYLKEEE
jgi:hypothetical protein